MYYTYSYRTNAIDIWNLDNPVSVADVSIQSVRPIHPTRLIEHVQTDTSSSRCYVKSREKNRKKKVRYKTTGVIFN